MVLHEVLVRCKFAFWLKSRELGRKCNIFIVNIKLELISRPLPRASFNPPTQTIGLPNRPCPTTWTGLKQPSINNGQTIRKPIQSTTRPCRLTQMVHIIPNVTAPPRHQSKILTPMRRTAGHPLLAAKAGATQVGKLVGRVTMMDKLPLQLLELLDHLGHLDHLVLDLLDLDLPARLLHQQQTVAPQPAAKVPAKAAELKAAIQKAEPTSSIPTPPPFQDSPAPATQDPQAKEVGRISSCPTPPPCRASPVVPTAQQEQAKEAGRISSIPTTAPLRKSLSTRAAAPSSKIRATTPPMSKRWLDDHTPISHSVW